MGIPCRMAGRRAQPARQDARPKCVLSIRREDGTKWQLHSGKLAVVSYPRLSDFGTSFSACAPIYGRALDSLKTQFGCSSISSKACPSEGTACLRKRFQPEHDHTI